ncbi:MAG: hypothetical protein J5732_00835 [Bacteroidaceae bacterium]|nr:hypothetical protein [Bacteroidaceae bacterium]
MVAYKTSKNYKHLIELLDKGIEVICFYTYIWNEHNKNKPDYEPIIVTDVCMAKLLNKNTLYEHYNISCRGTGFLDYWTKDMPYDYTFEELLEARGIEYIEPDNL